MDFLQFIFVQIICTMAAVVAWILIFAESTLRSPGSLVDRHHHPELLRMVQADFGE